PCETGPPYVPNPYDRHAWRYRFSCRRSHRCVRLRRTACLPLPRRGLRLLFQTLRALHNWPRYVRLCAAAWRCTWSFLLVACQCSWLWAHAMDSTLVLFHLRAGKKAFSVDVTRGVKGDVVRCLVAIVVKHVLLAGPSARGTRRDARWLTSERQDTL